MQLYYFAYGSNMLPERLLRRVPSAALIGPALLPHFQLVFHKRSRDGSGKCDILPDSDAEVWGGLYALALKDRRALDRAEGFGYLRQTVRVHSAASAAVLEAFAYRARPGTTDPALRPYDWYHGLVVRGAESLRLPPAYVRGLCERPRYPDPNRGRARRHWAILRAADRRRRHRQTGFYKMRKRERRHAGGRAARL